MIKILLGKISFHVKNNYAYYGISVAALMCGAAIAAVCAFSLSELNAKELSLYFDDFFAGFKNSGADAKMIMADAIRSNAFLFIVLALASTMVIGAPFIVLAGMYRGFAFGFAVAFVFRAYGARALLFLVAAVIPHLIITLPCLALLLSQCLRFCISLIRDKSALKLRLVRFFMLLAGIFAVMLAGALMQAYIEPILLSCFAGYFA